MPRFNSLWSNVAFVIVATLIVLGAYFALSRFLGAEIARLLLQALLGVFILYQLIFLAVEHFAEAKKSRTPSARPASSRAEWGNPLAGSTKYLRMPMFWAILTGIASVMCFTFATAFASIALFFWGLFFAFVSAAILFVSQKDLREAVLLWHKENAVPVYKEAWGMTCEWLKKGTGCLAKKFEGCFAGPFGADTQFLLMGLVAFIFAAILFLLPHSVTRGMHSYWAGMRIEPWQWAALATMILLSAALFCFMGRGRVIGRWVDRIMD